MATAEPLPLGAGRVPAWWMECTPHNLLDLEEDAARRELEAKMSYYFTQMAAVDEEGLLGPDGKPILGPNGDPISFGSNWKGRAQKGSASPGPMSPGGRKFKLGDFKIDPKLFGISESDPNYQSYLTGAKLPPGFLEKMQELFGTPEGGIPNNLHQTDYGRYGRQAEKPDFKPSWMKKKLRSTNTGASIRRGEYNDSPNKHHRRKVEDAPDLPSPYYASSSSLNASASNLSTATPPPQSSVVVEQEPVLEVEEVEEPEDVEEEPAVHAMQPVVEELAEPAVEESAAVEEAAYVEATTTEMKKESPASEVVVDQEGEESSYEELNEDGEGNMDDLQAILAAKQAELAALQAQLG